MALWRVSLSKRLTSPNRTHSSSASSKRTQQFKALSGPLTQLIQTTIC